MDQGRLSKWFLGTKRACLSQLQIKYCYSMVRHKLILYSFKKAKLVEKGKLFLQTYIFNSPPFKKHVPHS